MRRSLTLSALVALGLSLSACSDQGASEDPSQGASSPASAESPAASSPASSTEPSGSVSSQDPSEPTSSPAASSSASAGEGTQVSGRGTGGPRFFSVGDGTRSVEMTITCTGGKSMQVRAASPQSGATSIGEPEEISCDGSAHPVTLAPGEAFDTVVVTTPVQGSYTVQVVGMS